MEAMPGRSTLAEEERIRRAYARRTLDGRYSWFRPDYMLALHQRERACLALLARHGFADRMHEARVFEVGCGTGQWLRDLLKWGARPEHVTGIDLLPYRIDEARRLSPSAMNLQITSGSALPADDDTCDIVVQSTVFTSILDADARRALAAEMVRIVKPDGLIIWYDYHMNNPTNADVRGVNKREIQRLFASCRIELRRLTLAPPIGRVLAPRSTWLCQWLEQVPWLCTHYLGAIRKGMRGVG